MRPIATLTAAVAIIGANSLLLSPLAGAVASSLAGASAADVLTGSAAYGIATAASALTLAPHADRIGLARATWLSLTGLGLALALSAVAPTLSVLIAAQALAGMAAGVCLPAIYGLAAELAPRGRAAQTLGRVLTGWTIALVLGVGLAAIVADWLHWRVVFAMLALACAAIVLRLRSLPNAPRANADGNPITALTIPGVASALALVILFMSAFYGLYAYLGAHVTGPLGASTTVAGLCALAYGLGFGIAAPLDMFIDRFGAVRVAPLVYGALVLCYLTVGAASGAVATLAGAAILWGLVNHLGLNLLVGHLTAIDPARRAAIMGLYSAATYIAMFAGTLAFRPVFEARGFGSATWLSAAAITVALVASLVTRRRVSRPS